MNIVNSRCRCGDSKLPPSQLTNSAGTENMNQVSKNPSEMEITIWRIIGLTWLVLILNLKKRCLQQQICLSPSPVSASPIQRPDCLAKSKLLRDISTVHYLYVSYWADLNTTIKQPGVSGSLTLVLDVCRKKPQLWSNPWICESVMFQDPVAIALLVGVFNPSGND